MIGLPTNCAFAQTRRESLALSRREASHGALVGVRVGVGVRVTVGVRLGVNVRVGVKVRLGVKVAEGVNVADGVLVAVGVGVAVSVGKAVTSAANSERTSLRRGSVANSSK